MKHRYKSLLIAALVLVGPAPSWAAQTYQSPEEFVNEVFQGSPPSPDVVWVIGDLADAAKQSLTHEPPRLREKFWSRDGRSVWILEEIGKEHPITAGWVIQDGRIESSRVLVYRESRGWEVRYPYFNEQFSGAERRDNGDLTRQVDGISGATLSVRAMKRMASYALLLHEHVSRQDERQ